MTSEGGGQMSDLISREDAINAVAIAALDDRDEIEAIKAIPSVQVSVDLIRRQDAIEAVGKLLVDGQTAKVDGKFVPLHFALMNTLSALPSAEAEPSLKAIKRQIDEHWYLDPPSAEAVQIPIKLEKRYPESKDEDITDAFMRGYLAGRSSAEAVQGEWIKTVEGNGWNEWWVFKCPFCGATIEDKQYRSWEYNFCPNCGSKMRGGDPE